MSNNWVLTQESFETLINWLDSDRETAGQKYEKIRRRLIQIFSARGCFDPETLADETINRVARKITQIIDDYKNDPALYFYGVARMVYLEDRRRTPTVEFEPALAHKPLYEIVPEDDSGQHECLDECLASLPETDRQLITQYYAAEINSKKDFRIQLAAEYEISLNSLRVRLFRVRGRLRQCVTGCVKKKSN